MRTILIAVVGLIGCAASTPPPAASHVPVVVELFTSEGCSSCPPADGVLSKLAAEGGVGGAQVIPLGMHVTYWDQLGWKDAASLPEATARQQAYSRLFGADGMYTPQAVIDGRAQAIGSDEGSIVHALQRAASQAHVPIAEKLSADGADAIAADVTIGTVPADASEPLDAQLFLTEDGITSNVRRGENAGRTLRHDAVVRAISALVPVPSTGPLHIRLALNPSWHRDRLHAVAVLQGRHSLRIWGAATVPVTSKQ
ncbi:MAG TPA: DUF1223 domain-containing protein [Vicinamibacterales bacterium]|jgi:hypothetical protein